MAQAEIVSLEFHQGLDYAVLMREGETTDSAFIQVTHPDEDDINQLKVLAAAPDLLNGCNAMVGLIQLVCGREDMPREIKDALQSSHRLAEARTAISKATGAR